MNDYQEARQEIRKALRDGAYLLEIVQKRPYTVALIRDDNDAMVGVGFAKVNHKDPWSSKYGRRLAVEKAIADAAKEALGDASLLKVDDGHVAVYPESWFLRNIPGWLLDADLGTQPREWKEAIPCSNT